MWPGDRRLTLPGPRESRGFSRLLAGFGYLAVLVLVVVFSNFVLSRLGLQMFVFALAGLTAGGIYVLVSFRSLATPFYVLILAVGALRFIWAVKAPILPDLYFDRISLIWMTMVFMVTYFAKGLQLKRPLKLDLFVAAHGLYILIRVYMGDLVHFHTWTMSVMTPYAVFFFAKNVISSQRQIRILMYVLLALSIYWNVTSVAEKYSLHWLLYPKYMIEPHPEFIGRSTGPFRNSGIFGNAIGMLLPVHLYFMNTTRNGFLKVLLAGSMALGFGALFFSYTRGSWLSGAACLMAVAFFSRRLYFRTMIPMLILVPFIALYFLGLGQDKFMKERVENDDTIGSRVGTIVTVLRVWQDYPILGCGSFSYNQFREDYIAPVDVPILGSIRFIQFRHNSPHDIYMGPLAEDGIVGMGLQFTIYFLFLRDLFRKYRLRKRGDPFAVYIVPLFLGVAASYLIGGLTISYRNSSILGVLFYMCAGISYGYRPEEQEDRKTSEPIPRGGA